MRRQLICSNPECSPLAPFVGTTLERVYSEDRMYNLDGTLNSTTMYCGLCKGHYIYETNELIPNQCPKCHTDKKWGVAKVWRMICPKCSKSNKIIGGIKER